MASFTRENAAEMAKRGAIRRRAIRKERQTYAFPPAKPWEDAHERQSRLWGLVAAIDKRIAFEVEREHPNGPLLRDLAATRRTLAGPESKDKAPDALNDKPATPTLAEPVPVQE